jgi:hypothetical protein
MIHFCTNICSSSEVWTHRFVGSAELLTTKFAGSLVFQWKHVCNCEYTFEIQYLTVILYPIYVKYFFILKKSSNSLLDENSSNFVARFIVLFCCSLTSALQRHNTEIRNKYSQKRICAATVPIPTLMFLWAIYIFPWSACLFCCLKIGGPNVGILYICRSLTDTWMWKLGLKSRNHFWEYMKPNFLAVWW